MNDKYQYDKDDIDQSRAFQIFVRDLYHTDLQMKTVYNSIQT